MLDLEKTKNKIKQMGINFQESDTITFDQLNLIKSGNPFNEIKGITSIRFPIDQPGLILLHVIMGPRSYFKTHDHDCYEFGMMLSGEVFVNDTRHRPSDTFEFEAGERHRFYTEQGCTMMVSFRKV